MNKLLILCLTLILLGCSTSSVKKKSVKGIKEIQYTELKKLMKEDVSFMLYLGRPDCGDCQAFKTILISILMKVFITSISKHIVMHHSKKMPQKKKKSSIRISIKHLILIGRPH